MYTKWTSFWGQANWAKMTSPWGKLTAPAFYPTKKVNKADMNSNGVQLK